MNLKINYFVDANYWIYLNVLSSDDKFNLIELFNEVVSNGVATNLLVLDETLYISKKKYGVSYNDTLDFWQQTVVPTTIVLDIGQDLHRYLNNIFSSYNMKPSDAIHLATMYHYDISNIISEDDDFDDIENISRKWI